MTIMWTSSSELPSSGRTTIAPPCAGRPDDWDLDVGTPDTWRAAVRTCQACPLQLACAERAATLSSRGEAPRAMIWAGVGYDNSGNIIASLEHHRVVPADVKRPMVTIRTSRAVLALVDDAMTRTSIPTVAPRRRIVLRADHRPRKRAVGD